MVGFVYLPNKLTIHFLLRTRNEPTTSPPSLNPNCTIIIFSSRFPQILFFPKKRPQAPGQL